MKRDGGPAFPIGSGDMRDPTGLTLRDYFAAAALNGILGAPDPQGRTAYTERLPIGIAYSAYDLADAMLFARGGGNDEH